MPDAVVNKGQRNNGCLRTQKLMTGAAMGHAGFLLSQIAYRNREMMAFTDKVVKALDKSRHSESEARDFERFKSVEQGTQMTVLQMLAAVPGSMKVGELREKVRQALLTAESERAVVQESEQQHVVSQHEEMAEAPAPNQNREQEQEVVPTVEPMEVDTEPEVNKKVAETHDAPQRADENESAKDSPLKIGTKPAASPSRIPVVAAPAKATLPGFMQPTKNSKSKSTVEMAQQSKPAASKYGIKQTGTRKARIPAAIGSAARSAQKKATSAERAARNRREPVPFKVQKIAQAPRAKIAAATQRAPESSRNGTSRPQPAVASRAIGVTGSRAGTSSSTTSSTVSNNAAKLADIKDSKVDAKTANQASGPISRLPVVKSNPVHPPRPNAGPSAVGNRSPAKPAVETPVTFTPRTATTGEYVRSLRRSRHEKLKARKMAKLSEEQATPQSPVKSSPPTDPKEKTHVPPKRAEYLTSLYDLLPSEAQGNPASTLSQKRKRFFAPNDKIVPNEEPSSKKRKVMVNEQVSPSEIRRIVNGPRPKRKKGVALPRLPIVSRKFAVFKDNSENDVDVSPEQSFSKDVEEQDPAPEPLDHATLESILFPEIANEREQTSSAREQKKAPVLAPKVPWDDDSFDEEDTPSPTKRAVGRKPGHVYTNYQTPRRRSGMGVATIRVVPKSNSLVPPSESRLSEESQSTIFPTAAAAPSRAFQVFRDDQGEIEEVATIRVVPESSSLVEPSGSRISEDVRTANSPAEPATPPRVSEIFQDDKSTEPKPPRPAFRRPGTPIPPRPFPAYLDSLSEDPAPKPLRSTRRRPGTPIPFRSVDAFFANESDLLPDPEPVLSASRRPGTPIPFRSVDAFFAEPSQSLPSLPLSQPTPPKTSDPTPKDPTPSWHTTTTFSSKSARRIKTPYKYPPIPEGFKKRSTRIKEWDERMFKAAGKSHLPSVVETAEEQDQEWMSTVDEGDEKGDVDEMEESEWNITQDFSGNVYVEDSSEQEDEEKERRKGRKRKSDDFAKDDEIVEEEVKEVKEVKRRKVETGIPRPKMDVGSLRGVGGKVRQRRRWM